MFGQFRCVLFFCDSKDEVFCVFVGEAELLSCDRFTPIFRTFIWDGLSCSFILPILI